MFRKRIKIFLIILAVLFLSALMKMGYLQLLKAGEYRRAEKHWQERLRYYDAMRGDILDRNGEKLATSQPGYDVCIVINDVLEIDDIESWYEKLNYQFGFDEEYLANKITSIMTNIDTQVANADKAERNYVRYKLMKTAFPIMEDVDKTLAFYIESHPEIFNAIIVKSKATRRYPHNDLACHIIGYLSKISLKQYNEYKDSYAGSEKKRYDNLNDYIGKTGVESQYNALLRGEKGFRHYIVNALGKRMEDIELDPPKAGKNVRLTIDWRIQKIAEDALGNLKGAVVILDVKTGEILAMASSPRYDLNTVRKNYVSLLKDEDNPLLNRASLYGNLGYPLGSTFKVVTAFAGLESGKVDENTTFNCPGYLQLGNLKLRCLGYHGDINLHDAMKKSCNTYFRHVGLEVGTEELARWAHLFGFGAKTNVDIPIESSGVYPDNAWIQKYHGRNWSKGDIANVSIGQGDLLVTPLQVAKAYAIIANNGKVYTPHFVRDGKSHFEGTIPVSNETLRMVKDALFAVVESGTAQRARIDGLPYAAKTGTAESGKPRDHGWFAGFAPYEDPQISFAVFVEYIPEGRHGGDTAGPVAQYVLKEIFEKGYVR